MVWLPLTGLSGSKFATRMYGFWYSWFTTIISFTKFLSMGAEGEREKWGCSLAIYTKWMHYCMPKLFPRSWTDVRFLKTNFLFKFIAALSLTFNQTWYTYLARHGHPGLMYYHLMFTVARTIHLWCTMHDTNIHGLKTLLVGIHRAVYAHSLIYKSQVGGNKTRTTKAVSKCIYHVWL